MPIDVLMPALSPTMTEGNLVTWLKQEGDTVNAGDVLAEIETDKATMEVEAVDEGVLAQIVVRAGTENVQVNAVIARILEEGEDAAALPSKESAPSQNITEDTPPQSSAAVIHAHTPARESFDALPSEEGAPSNGVRIIASPLAKRIALAQNIDLKTLKGSGPKGRIIRSDVDAAMLHASAEVAIQTTHPTPCEALPSESVDYTDVPLSGMRKVIASRLVASKQTVPHFYLSLSCRIDALLALRKNINAEREAKISVNDFVIMAAARALKDVPDANVSFHDGFIRKYHDTDIAIAVAIEGGLVTPIIRAASQCSLGSLSSKAKTMIQKARDGKLQPHEFQGGSFCISNLGMYGIEQFQAIINPPQACILAVGAGVKKPVVEGDVITQATLMNCTLSVDHRAVDGALGAEFLQAFKKYIEDPMCMLVG